MRILVIHREGENEDEIKLVKSSLLKKGIESEGMKAYKANYFTGSLDYWVRQSQGYDLSGEKLYDGFIHIGDYADELSKKFVILALSEDQPLWMFFKRKMIRNNTKIMEICFGKKHKRIVNEPKK